jgi:AcrR family transcriptional regulator
MARSIDDNQILDAVQQVIEQYGYRNATTRLMAAAAGINEVTLFRRFGSRTRLVQALFEREMQVLAAAGLHYSGDLERDVTAIVETYQQLMIRRGALIAVLAAEARRDDELRTLLELPARQVQRMAELLDRHAAAGRLVAEDPLQRLAGLLGPLLLGQVMQNLPLAQTLLPLQSDGLVQRFLDGRRMRTAESQPDR